MGGPGSGRKKGNKKLYSYTATVKDRQGNLIHIEDKKYSSLSAFKKDLSKNGFRVYKGRMAESKAFEKIQNEGVLNWKHISNKEKSGKNK